MRCKFRVFGMFAAAILASSVGRAQQSSGPSPEQLAALKKQAAAAVDQRAKQVQVMVDTVFSFGELGYQEYETSKYLTGILEENGFQIQRGIAGIPTAWMATWGEGKPVIALGSDLDCVPQASQ
ncbi:MAG TPA: hypothetical protein VGR71_10580, partial [Nitrospira sp.]|nr:hypothetical protein [Nitrospira sp.]